MYEKPLFEPKLIVPLPPNVGPPPIAVTSRFPENPFVPFARSNVAPPASVIPFCTYAYEPFCVNDTLAGFASVTPSNVALIPISNCAPPDVVIVPPRMIPPRPKNHDPVPEFSPSVAPVFFSVPIRFTRLLPAREKLPISPVKNDPPRFTVPL
jgi:hypothetical protein